MQPTRWLPLKMMMTMRLLFVLCLVKSTLPYFMVNVRKPVVPIIRTLIGTKLCMMHSEWCIDFCNFLQSGDLYCGMCCGVWGFDARGTEEDGGD